MAANVTAYLCHLSLTRPAVLGHHAPGILCLDAPGILSLDAPGILSRLSELALWAAVALCSFLVAQLLEDRG